MPPEKPAPASNPPPVTTIIRLNAEDTGAWYNLPAFQDALITLARSFSPLVIKSDNRKILYRSARINPHRSSCTLHVSIIPGDLSDNAHTQP